MNGSEYYSIDAVHTLSKEYVMEEKKNEGK